MWLGYHSNSFGCVCVCLVTGSMLVVSAQAVSEAVCVKRGVGDRICTVNQWFRDCADVNTSMENKYLC